MPQPVATARAQRAAAGQGQEGNAQQPGHGAAGGARGGQQQQQQPTATGGESSTIAKLRADLAAAHEKLAKQGLDDQQQPEANPEESTDGDEVDRAMLDEANQLDKALQALPAGDK